MAYKIKKQKVNRKYLYACVKAQQEKINELFGTINSLRNIIIQEQEKQRYAAEHFRSVYGQQPIVGAPGGLPSVVS